jgi:hypothetical protein
MWRLLILLLFISESALDREIIISPHINNVKVTV